MAALPVITSTDTPEGGPALRVRAYAPGEAIPEGGPAVPVYVVSAGELSSGKFVAQGNPVPVNMVAVTGRVKAGRKPIPVVVVSGSFSPLPTTGTALVIEDGATALVIGDGATALVI